MEYTRDPSDEELAKASGYDIKYIQEYNEYWIQVMSLDASIGDDEESGELIDFIASEDKTVEDEVVHEEINNKLYETIENCLNDREKFVLERRFGLNGHSRCTLEEVGNELNITREGIRLIEGRAIQKLKKSPGAAKFRQLVRGDKKWGRE